MHALVPMSQNIFGTWNSDFGPVTLSGSNEHVEGYWEQGPGKRGRITAGTFDLVRRVLAFSYYQDWSNIRGVASLTLSADALELNGTWSQPNGQGQWHFTRSRRAVA